MIKKYGLLIALMLFTVISSAQFDKSAISKVEEGKLFYTLNSSWTEAQKAEVMKQFNLDSTVWKKIKLDSAQITLDGVKWNKKTLSSNIFELSRPLNNEATYNFNWDDVLLIDESWKVMPGYVDQQSVIFGMNEFKKDQNFKYQNGKAVFFLDGYLKNKSVYIAGSFNDWDPYAKAMTKVDSGWIAEIKLTPGKYLYKYIVDGRWMTDPNNPHSDGDGQGNINSELFCPNYTFKLSAYPKARKVFLAGSFNNWNASSLKMKKYNETWQLPVYLRDGTHTYKFIVDGDWIVDPANPKLQYDGKGNTNSLLGFGEQHVFILKGYTSATKVYVTGGFADWSPEALLMEKTPEGWQLPYYMSPGNYEYKFVVDGKWITDPDNPFTTGKDEHANSLLAFKPNYIFTVNAFTDAKEVRITGDFYSWNTEGIAMIKKDGKWIFPLYLSKGKHLYKLIVGGEMVIDPSNKLWEENEYGTGNSFVWKE